MKNKTNKTISFLLIPINLLIIFLISISILISVADIQNKKSLNLLIEANNESDQHKKDSLYIEYIKACDKVKEVEEIIPFL